MFKEINAAVHLIRPTALLYLAADGVAPLAKKQRTGRFAHLETTATIRAVVVERELAAGAAPEAARAAAARVFDKNAISPGTVFMEGLEARILALVQAKLAGTGAAGEGDVAWAGLRVVFSGHTVPGEGEVSVWVWGLTRLTKGDAR